MSDIEKNSVVMDILKEYVGKKIEKAKIDNEINKLSAKSNGFNADCKKLRNELKIAMRGNIDSVKRSQSKSMVVVNTDEMSAVVIFNHANGNINTYTANEIQVVTTEDFAEPEETATETPKPSSGDPDDDPSEDPCPM